MESQKQQIGSETTTPVRLSKLKKQAATISRLSNPHITYKASDKLTKQQPFSHVKSKSKSSIYGSSAVRLSSNLRGTINGPISLKNRGEETSPEETDTATQVNLKSDNNNNKYNQKTLQLALNGLKGTPDQVEQNIKASIEQTKRTKRENNSFVSSSKKLANKKSNTVFSRLHESPVRKQRQYYN